MGLALMGLIGLIASQYMHWIWPLMWLVVVGALLFVGPAVLARMTIDDDRNARRNLRRVVCLSAINGVAYGSALIYFPALSHAERTVVTIILTGLCTGAMTACAGYLPILAIYLVTLLVPLAGMWAIDPGHGSRGWIADSLSMLVLLYGAFLVLSARNSFATFKESFALRYRQLELTQQLRVALDRAESAGRVKTRFLASASHDLRQPIHTLTLYCASLSMQSLDARTREIADRIESALGALASQLDALLDVSRLDAGIVTANVYHQPLRPLLERLYEEHHALCADKGLNLRLDCVDAPAVHTDAVLLERVLRNLISNAIKYTSTGEVVLGCQVRARAVVLYVKDTGHGIPVTEKNRIFEEFYQLDNPERDRRKGLGLGLAIVRRLAEILDIELEVHSTPDQGSCFELHLPISATVIPGSEFRAETRTHPPRKNRSTIPRGLDILVVDDEREVRMGMRSVLESMGHRVVLADGSEQALAAAKHSPPSIVLADMRLRGDDNGVYVIETIRTLYPRLPALLISGDTAPERLREANDANLLLLHKPVSASTLRRAIEDACQSG